MKRTIGVYLGEASIFHGAIADTEPDGWARAWP